MQKKLFTAIYIATLFFSCSSLRYVKKDELVLKKIKVIHQKDDEYNKIDVDEVLTQKPTKKNYKLIIYKLSPKRFRNNLSGPAVFDSILAEKSVANISLLLKRNGFFDNHVEATANIKNRFVRQTFNINYGKQYTIGKVTYQLKQKNIERIINSNKNELIIKSGNPFLFNQLKKERELITELVKGEGFFFFEESHVSFKLDSSKSKKIIDVICIISNPKATDKNTSQEHQKFKVKRINVIEKSNNTKELLTKDFSIFDNPDKPKYSLRLFNKSIDIRKDSIALNKDINSTYRKLYGLNVFKTVKITNKPLANNNLEVNINLESQEKKSITTSLVGKYTGGDAGFEGGVSFNNKNLLKGAEKLTISVFGGFELQSTNTSTSSLNSFNNSIFSSFDIGPKVSLEVPLRIIPINFEKFERKYSPLSKIEASFSALARAQYERLLSNLSLNYIIRPEKKNFSHIITPFNVSYIKINLSEKFEKEIESRNNPFITNSYTDHFIISSQYQFLYRKNQRDKTTSLKVSFESAGNLLRLIHQLTNHPLENNSYHKLFDIRYAQYVRIDADYRYNYKNRIATRLFFGVGIPYGNLDILPFAKSFGAGGSNSMRAWNSNSLGPGGSNEADILLFNQVGDLKIEGNIEYRFPIYKYLKGAIFTDVGNIWMLKPDVKRERSNIEFSRFLSDLAVGIGSGLRLDFDFFVFRLDFALPLKNPQSSNPNKLSLNINELKINIGVGYPF